MARSRSRTAEAKPASDAYTGLLVISLVPIILYLSRVMREMTA